MSTIFIKTTLTDVQPRKDATIRIRYYRSTDPNQPEEYQSVQLLEFHPDWDPRMKARSEAYVRWELWMTHPAYQRAGVGYLEPSEQFVPIREFMIHEDDLLELKRFCAKYRDHGPLIIHPCPRPFPMFKKGERVTAVGPDMWERDRSGALGTVAEDSSEGGMTSVTFDTEEYNKSLDGSLCRSMGIPSINLRLAKDLVRSAIYESLLMAPLWRYYEAAKIALTELDAISVDRTLAGNPSDWDYIKRQKAKMRKEIEEFEQRFPDYKGV